MHTKNATALALGCAAALALGACGDDSGSDPSTDTGIDTTADTGADIEADTGVGDDASDTTDTVPQPTEPRWVVGGWVTTADEYTGYLAVVDDLSSEGNVDLEDVVEFGGDMVYGSPGNGLIYVGLADSPVIERWIVNDEDELEKDGSVSLSNFGVTTALGGGRNVLQFVDDDTAWYFDNENLQVIVFDPVAMTTDHAFSIDGLVEEGQELGLNYVHRDGDTFIITARYWDEVEGTTTPLVRAAFIDSADETVDYVDDTRCGDLAFQVTDDAGNLYLGSHPGHAVYMEAGLDGENPPPQCILRINKGETAFDAEYFVNLTELADGVAGGLLQGTDDNAYVFVYTGEPITAENWRPSLRGDGWAVYRLVLGDEASTFAAVPGLDSFTAYGDSFTTVVDDEVVPYLVAVEADFSAGKYYDVSDPGAPVEALAFPGYPGEAIRID